jgi:hypothetical protein
MKASPGKYEELATCSDDKYAEQILLDMHRTFPNNIHFRPDGCARQKQLHRVLVAYSNHNPGVGYCQVGTCRHRFIQSHRLPPFPVPPVGLDTERSDQCVNRSDTPPKV